MTAAHTAALALREEMERADREEAGVVAVRTAPSFEWREGLYTDIPMDAYLAIDAVHASALEKLRRSALQYLHGMLTPPEPSDYKERGTALHLAILEPHLFEGHYVVLGRCEGVTQKKDRCSNAGSIYRNAASYCGIHDPQKGTPLDTSVEVLGQKDFDDVLGMRKAVLAHPRARSLFEGKGAFEATVLFADEDTGLRVKERPDRLIERAGMLVDIKTTFDAAPWAFPRQAENLGYFRKLALYRRGLRAIGWPLEEIAILAIESRAPYDIACYLLDPHDLDGADEEVTRLLRYLKSCEESDQWDGYGNDFLTLQRPAWAKEAAQ